VGTCFDQKVIPEDRQKGNSRPWLQLEGQGRKRKGLWKGKSPTNGTGTGGNREEKQKVERRLWTAKLEDRKTNEEVKKREKRGYSERGPE